MSRGPRGEDTKAIFAFIREHQPVSRDDLAQRFQPQAAAVGMAINVWLGRKLQGMSAANFIEHGPHGWSTASDLELSTSRGPGRRRPKADEEGAPLNLGANVAQPRRIDMFGPSYQPAPQAHRAGADDYARLPSVINGQPRPYRSAW